MQQIKTNFKRGLFPGKTPRRLLVLGILLILGFTFSCPLLSYGEEKEIKEYNLPDHGVLQLNVPKSWQDEATEAGPDRPLTIRFRPQNGKEFDLTIIPLWSIKEDLKLEKEETIRNLMKEDWKLFAKHAKEHKLILHKFPGTETMGYYYQATDKAPKKGEYKYMVRAGIKVGDLILNATFLSLTKDPREKKLFLTLLEEAKQKSDKSEDEGKEKESKK